MSRPAYHFGLLVAEEEPAPNPLHSPAECALIGIVLFVVVRLVWAIAAWVVAL